MGIVPHFYPGLVLPSGRVMFVGKPKRQQVFTEDNRLIPVKMVAMAFECPDGVVRKSKFCQSFLCNFTPGQTDDYVPVEMSDATTWPKSPTQGDGTRLPSKPRACCRCGCTDARACPSGCGWMPAPLVDVCTACATSRELCIAFDGDDFESDKA